MAKQDPWLDEFAQPAEPRSGRRDELDALRGFAMLLGVLLHGSLAYFRTLWPVQDREREPLLAAVFDGIHGFRMPLFFLLSGYFTCLLWRRRGLGRMVLQRARRIALPLGIGIVTIIPLADYAVDQAVAKVFARQDRERPTGEPEDLWAAVRQGNLAAIESQLQAGANPERRDPVVGKTPLNWAASEGQAEAIRALLAEGIPVDGLSRGLNTALHAAAFYGRVDAALVLLEAGANPESRNVFQMTPAQAMLTEWGATFMIAQTEGLEVSQGEVLAGRREIATAMRERGVEVPEDDRLQPLTFVERIELLQREPYFHHLWFLWFLVLFVVVFPLSVPLLRVLARRPRWNHRLVRFPGLLAFFLLGVFLQRQMDSFVFGPGSSLGLVPDFWVLAYYASFFWFGAIWLLADDSRTTLGRDWWFTLPFALMVVLPLGRWFHEPSWQNPLSPSYPEFAPVAESLYAWMMVTGSIGLARQLFRRESRVLRAVADASYWIYFVHLPLIILLQLWLLEWEVGAWTKLLTIVASVAIGLFLLDRTLVRWTPLRLLFHSPRPRASRADVAD